MNKTSSPSFQNTKKQILYTYPTKKTKNKKKTSLQLNDTDIYQKSRRQMAKQVTFS